MLFSKIWILSVFFCVSAFAADGDMDQWFRNEGEWLAFRSTRQGVMNDPNTKIITDGLRYDVSVGKRIPLFVWAQESHASGWSAGVDGGMLASLRRQNVNGSLAFSTNTFDGHFGAYIGYSGNGWIAMGHTAHISAHLVDGISTYQNPIRYSRFWNDVIVGKDLFDPEGTEPYEIYLQGNIGMGNNAVPATKNPVYGYGFDAGVELAGADSIAIKISFDTSNAGTSGQGSTYSEFVGIGYLSKPKTMHRPFRAGMSHYTGSDFRNQLFSQTQNFTAFEIQTVF